MHKYTDAEKKFFRDYTPGHSYREIQKAFTDEFGWEISLEQIKGSIKRYGLNTGRTGRFVKGQVAHNKGKKMPPEIYEKTKRTMFKKGNVPSNHKPVGTERITVDGYIEIKVEEPNKWRLKHNLVYEQNFGEIPKGHVVMLLDGNKLNCEISNLKLIKRSELLIVNRQSLYGADAQATEVATNLARLIDTTNRKKKRNNGTEEKSTKQQSNNH